MPSIGRFISRKQNFIFLLLIVLLAYWPLTFHVFSLKNDALVYFLPYRYQVSETIRHGSFPWWNPYTYTGLPLHSDIQSGVWNPVVMLVSLFTTYDMSVLEWELLFYLFVAAVGMYKLIRGLHHTRAAALIAGIAYACSGFMTDSGSLVPWITSAAYLPFVFLYFFRLMHEPNLLTSLKLSLALVLLLTAGYPSFFIFCGYILIAGFIAWAITQRKNFQLLKKITGYSILTILIFLIISSPVILSWWDFFPYYERGHGATLDKTLSNSFTPFSTMSYLLPSAVSKQHPFLNTDISARNASVGIFCFVFFIIALLSKLKPVQKFTLAVVIFSFLFSLGDVLPLREWCYRFLPYMDTFRHPASIRVFSTIGIIVVAAPALSHLLSEPESIRKKIMGVMLGIIALITAILLYYSNQTNLRAAKGNTFEKTWLDILGLPDLVVIQGAIQLLFLLIVLLLVWRKKRGFISELIIANSILFCWMALPFTFVSKVGTSVIDNYVHGFPEGFPAPSLKDAVNANFYSDPSKQNEKGDPAFYIKKVLINDHIISPTIPIPYGKFLADSALRKSLEKSPVAYLSDSSSSDSTSLLLTRFSTNEWQFQVKRDSTDTLHLFQQYHHGWEATVDEKPAIIMRADNAFMAIALPPGTHHVDFRFRPAKGIIPAMYISLCFLTILLLFFIFRAIKRTMRK